MFQHLPAVGSSLKLFTLVVISERKWLDGCCLMPSAESRIRMRIQSYYLSLVALCAHCLLFQGSPFHPSPSSSVARLRSHKLLRLARCLVLCTRRLLLDERKFLSSSSHDKSLPPDVARTRWQFSFVRQLTHTATQVGRAYIVQVGLLANNLHSCSCLRRLTSARQVAPPLLA